MGTSKKFAALSPEDKRKYWNIYNERARKRRRLKNDIAKFATTLQTRRGSSLDARAMLIVNEELKQIIKLPHNWTDIDLERARRTLDNLSKKYLFQPFYKISSDKATVMTECLKVLDNTDLNTKARADVLYELLRQEVQKLYLHESERMEPTAHNALLFLTQDLQYTMPAWFHGGLIELLEEKYRGKDFTAFMTEIRKKMQLNKMRRNFEADAQAALERENREDIIL